MLPNNLMDYAPLVSASCYATDNMALKQNA